MINFSVVLKPGIPIYSQLVYAAKKAIVSGQLQPGDRFPSVRELSKELGINPNTVQKAIGCLVREKLVEIKPGVGGVVCAIGRSTDEQRKEILSDAVTHLIVESRKLMISKNILIEAVERQWELTPEKGTR